MKREIIITADGSSTIHIPDWNEQYHSKHGAIQEAQHVFISKGLHFLSEKYQPKKINILEIGFGTGLNALLTAMEANQKKININYKGIEAYPIAEKEIENLNYGKQLSTEAIHLFEKIHKADWEKQVEITPVFSLKKEKLFFEEITETQNFNLIYFDAFGARVQPELWEKPIFQKMYNALTENGVLVTYSAKGSAKRAMQEVGFTVEKIPGPPGKREMLRAEKNNS
ncbi:tRNA (5-methylaminomethyl-2-thiouridine)(34)-methyltransferase MnmD [Mesonia maritima]|uniref:tRNA U34 5-methylaminomethyl-2-thiouridine-forming methyltransferase MnmC n=1 Tax=Mesonia maritima TaxID=1793873 RepID=A0ABU1K4J9_9FLAO|nr:tRNA (5-methylaminomethyl-2-thiouridine)(34)-methyltransferase MnmD [Mesonia maritima]MDR6300526.1 tRNA U34 5-methylaminomethyl-2-thiouridine-forming methyltransferase MnmC [Mesonia maritima]